MSDEARKEYLAAIAEQFPARDKRGYVMGFYVYDGDRRDSGPYATNAEAQEHAEKLYFGGRVLYGPVFTNTGTLIRDGGDE